MDDLLGLIDFLQLQVRIDKHCMKAARFFRPLLPSACVNVSRALPRNSLALASEMSAEL